MFPSAFFFLFQFLTKICARFSSLESVIDLKLLRHAQNGHNSWLLPITAI